MSLLSFFFLFLFFSSSIAQQENESDSDLTLGSYDYLGDVYNAELTNSYASIDNDIIPTDEEPAVDVSEVTIDEAENDDNIEEADIAAGDNNSVDVEGDADNDMENDVDKEMDDDIDSGDDSPNLRSLKKKKAKYSAPTKMIVPMPMQMPMQGKKGGYSGYGYGNYGGYGGHGGYGGQGGYGYYGGYYRRALKEYAPPSKSVVQAPRVPSKPVVVPDSSYVPVRQNYVEVAVKAQVPVYSKTAAAPVYAPVASNVISVVPGYNKVESSYEGVSEATLRYLQSTTEYNKIEESHEGVSDATLRYLQNI